MTSEKTIAAIADEVRSCEGNIVAALSRAYALGYAAGYEDAREMDAARIVRVGEQVSPEVKSDAH